MAYAESLFYLFEGAPVRSNSLGNRKSYYRMCLLREVKAVGNRSQCNDASLQNRALWIGPQHFDAVDKDSAALIGN